jgi:CPA2 family monovalent cation:H+ antiporter-2
LISFALGNAVLSQESANLLLLVVAFSMLLTPLLFILYERVIAPRYARGVSRLPTISMKAMTSSWPDAAV